MGISVEQYRSRIGSHDNFVKTKDALSRFKDRFWNIMLMMFYMNVFYLPTLKSKHLSCLLWLTLTCLSLKSVFADNSRNISDILSTKVFSASFGTAQSHVPKHYGHVSCKPFTLPQRFLSSSSVHTTCSERKTPKQSF